MRKSVVISTQLLPIDIYPRQTNCQMNKLSIIFISVAALGLTGCNPYHHIYSNYDQSIDFDQYATFAWGPDSASLPARDSFRNTAYDNDIVRNNAKNYITYEMGKRGLLVNVDSPDVILQLVLVNEKKEKIETYATSPYPYARYYYYNRFYFPYYYPYYRYYTWFGWSYPPYSPYWDQVTTYTKTYVRGTITINMFDRKLGKLVWSGSAEGDIYDPSFLKYDVHPAIDRILKKFPIRERVRWNGKDEQKLKDRISRADPFALPISY